MRTFEGKVAFITGAARGQGRSHALHLAREGADIIAVDVCKQLDTVEYAMATPDDLAETARLVEELGSRIITEEADVRDAGHLQEVVQRGLAELGHIDVVLANAGIMPTTQAVSHRQEAWQDAIDIMLTGALNTVQAAVPSMVDRGQGGAIVLTSSIAGLKGATKSLDVATLGMLGYHAAKHGVIGLMRCYANALAPHSIRVNTVNPTGVNSPMIANQAFGEWVAAFPEIADGFRNALPVEMIECEDVSNAVAWLCSDAARYVTGVVLPVDAGATVR